MQCLWCIASEGGQDSLHKVCCFIIFSPELSFNLAERLTDTKHMITITSDTASTMKPTTGMITTASKPERERERGLINDHNPIHRGALAVARFVCTVSIVKFNRITSAPPHN